MNALTLKLLCIKCGSSAEVVIDPDDQDEWYTLATICRRMSVRGHRVTVPLVPQLFETWEKN